MNYDKDQEGTMCTYLGWQIYNSFEMAVYTP